MSTFTTVHSILDFLAPSLGLRSPSSSQSHLMSSMDGLASNVEFNVSTLKMIFNPTLEPMVTYLPPFFRFLAMMTIMPVVLLLVVDFAGYIVFRIFDQPWGWRRTRYYKQCQAEPFQPHPEASSLGYPNQNQNPTKLSPSFHSNSDTEGSNSSPTSPPISLPASPEGRSIELLDEESSDNEPSWSSFRRKDQNQGRMRQRKGLTRRTSFDTISEEEGDQQPTMPRPSSPKISRSKSLGGYLNRRPRKFAGRDGDGGSPTRRARAGSIGFDGPMIEGLDLRTPSPEP